MTPPVLFRLPSVQMPGPDSAVNASNMSSAAMAMPMAASVAASMPASSAAAMSATSSTTASSTTSSMTSQPSAAAPSAAATISAEKASGQRMLNMMIIVLLLAALAVITWISMTRPVSSPSMAERKVGNDAALDTLGDLKVPDVTTGAAIDVPPAKPTTSSDGLNLDEIKPANPADLSLIDLPAGAGETKSAESLMVGIDLSGTDASVTKTDSGSPETSLETSTPTAQIQLRAPVPMGNSNNITSLVDAQRPTNPLGNASLGSSTTPRVDTVSTPTQPGKVFPANPSSTSPTSTTTSTTTSSGNTTNSSNSGGSPTLWDGAQRTAPEGLQLSNNSTGSTSSSGSMSSGSMSAAQVHISKPLSAEISMNGTPSKATTLPNQTAAVSASPGVTVGGGEKEPYTLPASSMTSASRNTSSTAASDISSNLQKSRPDLDPTMLARVAASGAAKSAVSSSSLPASKPINSFTGTTGPNTTGQNLYQNSYANLAPASATSPINSYGSVPPGTTGNGAGAYIPPTTTNTGAQTQMAQTQMASGPASMPGMTASYNVPPRGTQFSSPTYPTNAAYTQPGYAQPGYAQPSVAPSYPTQAPQGYQQPPQQQSTYPTQPQGYPSAQQGYTQPTYTTNGYGQPNMAYGAASGSGYANPTYQTPSAGLNTANMPNAKMPSANMPGTGYQNGASYPTQNPYPSGQMPAGLIGPAGHATAPSGDIAPQPVMGRGGIGTSTPYGSPQ